MSGNINKKIVLNPIDYSISVVNYKIAKYILFSDVSRLGA